MVNLKEHSERINLRPYACYHCNGIIGLTTNNILFVGAVKFKRSVTMECGYCEKTTYWKPSDETFNTKKRS